MLSILRLAAVGAVIAAPGCANIAVVSSIPLSTYKRLWSFDVRKVDITGFRAAARLPAGLEPTAVKVIIEVKNGASKSRVAIQLVAAPDDAEQQPLARFARKGYRVFAFQLKEEDAKRLERMRAEAGQGGDRGTISVGVDSCRHGPLPYGPLPTTTLLRTDTSGYFVLFDDLDLRAVASEEELKQQIPPCP